MADIVVVVIIITYHLPTYLSVVIISPRLIVWIKITQGSQGIPGLAAAKKPYLHADLLRSPGGDTKHVGKTQNPTEQSEQEVTIYNSFMYTAKKQQEVNVLRLICLYIYISIYIYICYSVCVLCVYMISPRTSHHQDYYIFSRGSRTKPSFATLGGGQPKIYHTVDGSEIPFPTTWHGAKTRRK